MTITCMSATTSNLSCTYNNGSTLFPGRGATLTFTATGAQSIDGQLLNSGLVFLVKNQSTQTQNGVYYVTTQGSPGVSCVLTRYPGLDSPSINNDPLVPVFVGLTQFQTIWSLGTPINTVGTDNILFVPVGSQNGIQNIRIVTVASDSVLVTDRVVAFNRAGPISFLIGSPTGTAPGTTLTLKDDSGNASVNNITISPSSGNIDGASSLIINTNYGSFTVVNNGTQWNVI